MRQYLCGILLLAVAAVVLVGFFIDSTGVASGVEWSPELFRHRSFRYFQFAGIQVAPKQTDEWASDLEEYLHAERLIPKCSPDEITWEFVRGHAPGVRGWGGDAKLLCKGMGCWGRDSAKEWVEWSRCHPELAKALWPEIVQRARRHQYFEVYAALLMYREEMRAARTAEEVREVLRRGDLVATK